MRWTKRRLAVAAASVLCLGLAALVLVDASRFAQRSNSSRFRAILYLLENNPDDVTPSVFAATKMLSRPREYYIEGTQASYMVRRHRESGDLLIAWIDNEEPESRQVYAVLHVQQREGPNQVSWLKVPHDDPAGVFGWER